MEGRAPQKLRTWGSHGPPPHTHIIDEGGEAPEGNATCFKAKSYANTRAEGRLLGTNVESQDPGSSPSSAAHQPWEPLLSLSFPGPQFPTPPPKQSY